MSTSSWYVPLDSGVVSVESLRPSARVREIANARTTIRPRTTDSHISLRPFICVNAKRTFCHTCVNVTNSRIENSFMVRLVSRRNPVDPPPHPRIVESCSFNKHLYLNQSNVEITPLGTEEKKLRGGGRVNPYPEHTTVCVTSVGVHCSIVQYTAFRHDEARDCRYVSCIPLLSRLKWTVWTFDDDRLMILRNKEIWWKPKHTWK